MKMKRFMLWAVCTMVVIGSCKNKGQTATVVNSEAISSEVGEQVEIKGQGTVPMPMFLYYVNPDYMQVVYWANIEKPGKSDSVEYDEDHFRRWALQDGVRRHAAGYERMFVESDKTIPIKYIGEQLLNPDGEEMYGGELHSRASIPSPGLKYALVNPTDARHDTYGGMYVIVHDDYMETHKPLTIERLSPFDDEKPFPDAVVRQLEQQYGMTIQRSEQTCLIGNRYVYGVVQFEPKDKKVLALEVLTDGDKVYSYPVEGYYDEEFMSVWNVDDGGEYASSIIAAAFEGSNGLEFCYEHYAPESCTVGMFFLCDGKFTYEQYETYHVMVDEQTPLWKKDLAQMRKLYLEHDSQEHKNYQLTRYCWIDIDGDGNEEIWLRDKDDKHGAFFSLKDGKIRLIGIETDRLHATFRQPRNGKGYLRVSGSVGGPSIYTLIFEIENSQTMRCFTLLESYGEIVDCGFDAESCSKEEAKEYLKSLPDIWEPYVYFVDIEE